MSRKPTRKIFSGAVSILALMLMNVLSAQSVAYSLISAQEAAVIEQPVFIEKDGLVVIEAESVELPYDWEERSSIGGYIGDGYIVYLSPGINKDHSGEIIRYQFNISKTGTYEFAWRSRNGETAESGDAENDSWLKVVADEAYKVTRGNSIDITRQFLKTHLGSLGEWNWLGHKVREDGPDASGVNVYAVFNEPGTYEFQITGRSGGHTIDRFVLWHSDVDYQYALDAARPESGVVGGTISNPPVITSPADATPAAVSVGESTQLSVVAQPSEGGTLSYSWRLVNGPAVPTIATPDAAATSVAGFTASGDYDFEVTVQEGTESVISLVTITVSGDGGSGTVVGDLEVKITSPTEADPLSESTEIQVTVDASDDSGIQMVYLRVNHDWLTDGVDTPPYVFNLGTLPPGNYELLARAVANEPVDAEEADFDTIDIVVVADPGENVAPVANSQDVSTFVNRELAITLTGSGLNVDNELSFSVVSGPTQGTLSGRAPDLTYTPNLDFIGSDSFRFMTNDGQLDSAESVVSIEVSNAPSDNLAPMANALIVRMDMNADRAITLDGSDPDGDQVTFHIVKNPVNGRLSGTAPNLTYTPNLDFIGADSFRFRTNDGQLISDPAEVSIVVGDVTGQGTGDRTADDGGCGISSAAGCRSASAWLFVLLFPMVGFVRRKFDYS